MLTAERSAWVRPKQHAVKKNVIESHIFCKCFLVSKRFNIRFLWGKRLFEFCCTSRQARKIFQLYFFLVRIGFAVENVDTFSVCFFSDLAAY